VHGLVARAHAEATPAVAVREGAPAVALLEVLRSLALHHPLIAAERENVRAAEADVLSARGEFDTVLSVQGRVAPAGYYDPRRADVVVEQPTPFAGASLYAGYRVGRGNIAPYYGEQRTLSGGEVRGGVRVPLLQDRSIDARRAGVRQTELAERASEAGLQKLRLDLERDAVAAYYAWVAAGLKLRVATSLLALAEKRDAQIAEKVALGALPSIEGLDNKRTILERTRQKVAARRAFEKASIDLSLFLRTDDGAPRTLAEAELPNEVPELPSAAVGREESARRALALRPDLSQLALQLKLVDVERTLGENRLLPRLDVFGEVSKDLGRGADDYAYTLRPTVFEAGLALSVPLWLRKARGKLRAVSAKLASAEQKLVFAQQKARAEVDDAHSQRRAAEERTDIAQRAVDTAEQVASGERERFELGASTVLFVNLREQAAADAQMAAIDAQAELGFANARSQLVTGESLLEGESELPPQ